MLVLFLDNDISSLTFREVKERRQRISEDRKTKQSIRKLSKNSYTERAKTKHDQIFNSSNQLN